MPSISSKTFGRLCAASSILQNNSQEGSVDDELAVVLDKAQFLELVHEEIDPRTRCSDHLCQCFLRHSWNYALGMVLLAIASEQQKVAGQANLTGVEQLVDQVFFDSD